MGVKCGEWTEMGVIARGMQWNSRIKMPLVQNCCLPVVFVPLECCCPVQMRARDFDVRFL